MSSNPAFVQYALKTCEKHAKKELTNFCKTCRKKICTSCVKEDHITHDWDAISEFAKVKRRDLTLECKQLREKDIVQLRRQIDIYDSRISKLQSDSTQNENKINDERKSLIDEINTSYDKKISENQKCTAEAVQQYKKRKENLQQKLQYLDKMTNALGTEGDTFSDHDIIEMEQEMRTELDNAKSYNAERYSHCTGFVPGGINVVTVVGMTGEIHNITVEETSTLKNFSSLIVTITPTSQGTAWVRENESNTANLITESGEKLKSLNTECNDLIVLQNGNIAFTHYTGCEIVITNDKEEVIQKINTKPLHPTWISKTENNDILVTLVDDGDFYSLLPTSRRIVQRMTLTGKVLHTYEFEEDGKTRLFTYPGKTAENKNTDVCVINVTSKSSGHLVVLHRDGGVKFTYKGLYVSPDEFFLSDVTCDSKCRIIISEMWSESLQLLSSRGQFIGVVRYFTIPPTSVALCGEKLWMGLQNGTVMVYRYD